MSREGSSGDQAPPEVVAIADARALARAERDWPEADRLMAELLGLGWKPIDRGLSYRLEPTHPPDRDDPGGRRFGRSDGIPSRLSEPATAPASIIVPVLGGPDEADRVLRTMARSPLSPLQLVVVLDGPAADPGDALSLGDPDRMEVIRTATSLGWAAATNMGVRRSRGEIVVVLGPILAPDPDLVGSVIAALADPTVAVAGTPGFVAVDPRHFRTADPGDVDAIGASCLAFRRADAAERGPIDEQLRTARGAAIWWSLILRDEGPHREPRRAVRPAGVALADDSTSGVEDAAAGSRDRDSRRDGYRIADRFGARRDLLRGTAG